MKKSTVKILIVTLFVAALAGCKNKDSASTDAAAGGDDMADSAITATAELAKAPDPHDPCRLLEPKEVEAVLGAPLAGAPYLGGNPDGDSGPTPNSDGDVCWYYTANDSNITIQADWKDAGAINAGISANLAKAEAATKGMLKLQDGTELTGDWDEARMRGCCTLVAIQGDSMVEINFAGSLTATAEQAGELANKALARLNKPLDISGQGGLKDALKHLLARYTSEDPCSLWSNADITQLLGTPKGDPKRSSNECDITYTGKDGRGHEFVATVTFINGYRGFRRDNATYGGFAKSINADNAGAGISLRESKGVEGPWEAASDGAIQFNTVNKDAQIAVRHGGMSQDDLRAFIGHGYAKIAAGQKK
ncbi:MAG: hypothetical protein ABI644_11350 [Arenimonas sp.]